MIEGIQQCSYQGKHRERLEHSREKMPGLEIMDKKIRGRELRTRGLSGRNLPNRRLDKEMEAVKVKSRMSG